jgi:mono/diheme cytochrome c family protein
LIFFSSRRPLRFCALRVKFFFLLSSNQVCENFSLSMTHTAQSTLRLRKIVFAALLAVICIAISIGVYQNRQWKISEEAKLRKNPLQASPAAVAAARAIYLDKCVQCHGEAGRGDGPDAAMYYPAPASLNDAKHMSTVTDGELFYEISEGRKPMPAFKKRLSEEQRWQLVLLVRSYAAESSNR